MPSDVIGSGRSTVSASSVGPGNRKRCTDYQRSVNQMKSYNSDDICELLYLPYLRTPKTKINSKQSAVYSGQISRVVTQFQILGNFQ